MNIFGGTSSLLTTPRQKCLYARRQKRYAAPGVTMSDDAQGWIGFAIIGTIATAIFLWVEHGPYDVPKYVEAYQSIADDAEAAYKASSAHLAAEILTDDSKEAITNIRAAYFVNREMALAADAAQDKADKESGMAEGNEK
jgi:hypothetical protein